MKSFLEKLLAVETLVATVLYIGVAAILFADVMSREILGTSIWGGQRIAVLLANGAALLGLAIATAKGAHIRPVVADKVVPERFEPILLRLSDLFAALVFAAGAWYAWVFVNDNRHMGFTILPLDWPQWIPQLVLVYGLFSTSLRYFIFAAIPDTRPQAEEAW